MKLTDYSTLGRSGLRVSRMGLGTGTFGAELDPQKAKEILLCYINAGGNFIDTADAYNKGRSEEILGSLIQELGLRDRLVLGSKYSAFTEKNNPNAGGNGRKNCYRALEGSLRRLKTDYLDLYWVHSWDAITPPEEVISTLDGLVKQGKIRYFGLSNTPAWYAARIQTIAEKSANEPVSGLQLEYSLVDRAIEREHIPASQHLGIGVCVWSPLAGGFLSGKYRQESTPAEGRLEPGRRASNPFSFKWFTERNLKILDSVLQIAESAGTTAAQVALNWVINRPGITSVLIGATSLSQLRENLAALGLHLPQESHRRLNRISALDPANPYALFGTPLRKVFGGGVSVEPWTAARCSGDSTEALDD